MDAPMRRMPIPAFYCVYMLRALNKPRNAVYIGSTPHPRRRLRQHNGELGKSGARKTVDLRPSEFAMFVWGFPSKVAALQFEWAWQNTYKSRHNDQQQRISGKSNYMKNKLDHLLVLLRSKSFQQWPLKIRFFNQQVYDEWKKRVVKSPVKFEVQVTIMDRQRVIDGTSGIDVTYKPMRDQLEKSTHLIRGHDALACAVCKRPLRASSDMVAVCTAGRCQSVSHLQCLAYRFREESLNPRLLIPESGKCPDCNSRLQWSDIARDSSLRANGKLQIEKLLQSPKFAEKGESDAVDEESDSEADVHNDLDGENTTVQKELDSSTISAKVPKAGVTRKSSGKTKTGVTPRKRTSPVASAQKASKKTAAAKPAIIPDSDEDLEIVHNTS